jgi:hypothetical protein
MGPYHFPDPDPRLKPTDPDPYTTRIICHVCTSVVDPQKFLSDLDPRIRDPDLRTRDAY